MWRHLLGIGLLLSCTSCGWINSYLAGSDNVAPPAELQPIADSLPVQKLWDVDVGAGTQGAFVKLVPVIQTGRVYAASYDGLVVAVDANDGELLWKVDTGLSITAGVGFIDDLVLVGTDQGQVVALQAADGEEVWRARASSEILAVPQGAEGVVVVRTIDGRFIGLDADSGEQLWIYTYTVPALTLRGTAAPLVAQGVAISGLDTGKLLVLSLGDGTPVWEKRIAPPQGRTELERLVDIDAEPRVVDSVLYIVTYQGNVTAIDLQNGNTLWSRDFSSYSGLDVDTRQVYITDDNDTVWALDRRSGGTLWKQTALNRRSLSTPVIINGRYVVVGDFEGYLHWLDATDGRLVGRVQTDDEGIAAAPVVRDNILYVLSNSGRLSALQLER
jgi:outer membrane protein assembly factor BamB